MISPFFRNYGHFLMLIKFDPELNVKYPELVIPADKIQDILQSHSGRAKWHERFLNADYL